MRENIQNEGEEKITLENKEEIINTNQYTEKTLTEEEMKSAEELTGLFTSHLASTYDISPDLKIKQTIPTGIDLFDTILGGGIATGLVQFVGNPGCGKSMLASKIISTGQRKWPGKFIGVYCDSEVAQTTDRLAQLGVTCPKVKPYSEGLTVEKIFKIIDGLCVFKEENKLMDIPSVIVWDSIANTATEAGMKTDNINEILGLKARILSGMLPKYVQKLMYYNISLVAVNQLRDKMSIGQMFPTPNELKYLGDHQIPGGKSVLFNSIQLFFLRPIGDIKGEYGFLGNRVRMKGVKNKLFTPNIEVSVVFSFEKGFSNFWTNFELLKDTKRIQSGAWVYLKDYSEKKFRQKEVIEAYRTDEKFRTLFDQNVEDVLKTEFIDMYASTSNSTVEVL